MDAYHALIVLSALGNFLGKSVARVSALGNFLEKVHEGRRGSENPRWGEFSLTWQRSIFVTIAGAAGGLGGNASAQGPRQSQKRVLALPASSE